MTSNSLENPIPIQFRKNSFRFDNAFRVAVTADLFGFFAPVIEEKNILEIENRKKKEIKKEWEPKGKSQAV